MSDAIVIPIIGKDQATAALKAVRGQVVGLGSDAKQTDGLLSKLGGALVNLGGFVLKAGLAAATAAFVGFGAALASGVQDARAHALVMAQTEQTITSMGNAAGVSAQHVEDFAASLSAANRKSLFGDDQIQAATNMLLTFGNIKGATLDLATTLTVDMAQALKKTPEDMSIMVGKILNSADAMSAAQRQGVSFSDAQLALGKRLFETGRIAEYQDLVLGELNKEFGGQAEAAAKADGGWAQLQDRWGEAKETLGTAVLPLLNTLVGALNDSVMPVIEGAAARFGDLIPWLDNFAQSLQIGAMWSGHLGEVITNALTPILGEELAGTIGQAIDGFQRLAGSVSEAIQPLIATFTDAETPIQGFIAVLSEVSPAFALLYGVASEIFPQLRALVFEVFGDISAYLAANGDQMVGQAQTTWQSIHDTILNLIQPIADIISAVLTQIAIFWQAHDDEILAFVGTTWTQINTIIQTAMQVINQSIVPALAAVAAFISEHGAEIQLIFSGVWQAIQALISGVLATIQGVINTTMAAVRGDWQGVWEGIKGLVDTQLTMILGIVTGVLNAIAGIFGTTLSEIGTNVSTKFGEFVTTVQTKIGEIIGVIQGLPAQVIGVGKAIVDTLSAGFQNAWDGFMADARAKLQGFRNMLPFSEPKDSSSPLYGLSKAGESIITMIASGMGANAQLLGDEISPILDKVNHELVAAFTGVGADVYDTTDNFRELLQQMGLTWEQTNKVDDALHKVSAAYRDVGAGSMEVGEAVHALGAALGLTEEQTLQLNQEFNKLAAGTRNSASQIAQAGGQVSDSWASALQLLSSQIVGSDLPGAVEEFGGYVMDGFIDGVEQKVGDALDAIDAIGRKIQEGFNDALELGSPPPWATDAGGFVMQGLLEGLEDGLPDLLSSLQQMGGVLEAQMGAINEQLAGKLTDAARKGLEAQRDSLQETIDAIADTVEGLGDKVHAALADAFDASADIDRQQMKNIDAVRRLASNFQAETQAALDQALTEAQKIQDPEQAAKFFQEQSNHILELAKLTDSYYAAINSGDTEHAADLERQIALAKSAQAAEDRAFGEKSQIAGGGALDDLHDTLEQITNTVTDPGSGAIHDLLAQLYDLQVRTDAAQTPPGVPPQQTPQGAPGTTTSMVMQQGAIVVNAAPGMNEQMIADMVMREIERRYQGRFV